MDLVIHVGWEYVLGTIGVLIAIAYYTNGQLTRIETSIEWIKENSSRTSRDRAEQDEQGK